MIFVQKAQFVFIDILMSLFTRCFSQKSVKENDEQQKRLFNEHRFSSGMDLPIHPRTIYPSTVLDKELTVGQFGEPQKAQRITKALHTARTSV